MNPVMLLHSVEASSEQSCLAWYCTLTLPSLHATCADADQFSSGEHRLSMASSMVRSTRLEIGRGATVTRTRSQPVVSVSALLDGTESGEREDEVQHASDQMVFYKETHANLK